MPGTTTTKKDLTLEQAKTEATNAMNANAAKVEVTLQFDKTKFTVAFTT
jgi:hypothetical protein